MEKEGESEEEEEEEEEEESGSEEEVDPKLREDVMKALGSVAVQSEDEVPRFRPINRSPMHSVVALRVMCQ